MCLPLAAVHADDLYHVTVGSVRDAEILRSSGVAPLLHSRQGYLILADSKTAAFLASSSVKAERLASDVTIDELAMDHRLDRANVGRYPLVFEEDELRIFRVDPTLLLKSALDTGLFPVPRRHTPIEFHKPLVYNDGALSAEIGLDSLIDLICQDSIESYLYRLEAFGTRLTGTDSCYAAGHWIADKFASFGYDSIVFDTFIGSQLWGRVPVLSYNIIATKVGSVFPDRQIIVGGHYDAVPDCPGADDNASGTVGVLEMARVLKNIETDMTFIFIAFDSEESWLWGSYHYADSVAAQGADIVYMQNLDMIGHIDNSDEANLYNGAEDAYSRLWSQLALSLVGITGFLRGSVASDHLPFQENGYDVTFVQEGNFSSEYHQPTDNTDHINFDYLTRMVKASLATVYVTNLAPPPVVMVSVRDGGDGQSLLVTWEPVISNDITRCVLYYGPNPLSPVDSINLPVDSSQYIVAGLQEGMECFFHVISYNNAGVGSIAYDILSGTPRSKPALPTALQAMPVYHGIKLDWAGENSELDFHHYQVIRDNALLPDSIFVATYTDSDPTLGSDLHTYLIVAVDSGGNISDTVGAVPTVSKAAALQEGRILAVNRSGSNGIALVDETATGRLMREALNNCAFDYFSDTAFSNPRRVNLFDLIDYELVVIGAEGGRQDDLGTEPSLGGILPDLGHYLSIGGKAVIFGRWGNITVNNSVVDTIMYESTSLGEEYFNYFHINYRVAPRTIITTSPPSLRSDFIGAHSLVGGYPELAWDSTATAHHTDMSSFAVIGIPCASFLIPRSGYVDVIYTYNSSSDSLLTEGKPVGWRYLKGEYEYVLFDIPLSFMEWADAVTALRKAVSDLGLVTSTDESQPQAIIPGIIELRQNHPNPFNLQTQIEFYIPGNRPVAVSLEIFNILGQRVATVFEGSASPGRHEAAWNGRDSGGREVASGLYLYRLKADNLTLTRKMVLLK